ncbi:single-stranded DNA-binding protein [Hylemonella gracilis]|uniref:Single-stranded DNA-binding protein n=1 Tax=Hylemonella gracilis ATCC 19624 TaxID=887062 RepID=F3KXT8_9BURK|nr:single-stranded DNA-binding protein [Hylemonella gracilis]EGI75363.1 single-strand-binding protein [Hylemonella gracilis ATCC 19624]
MASVNKVILVGNCGRDPEIRYLPSGGAVANISIATTSRRKDRNSGEMVEETQWHRVTFFERLAEIVGEYVKKGTPIYVEGRLTYRKYTDKDGIEKNATDIIASEMQLLGGRQGMGSPDEEGGGGGYGGGASRAPARSAAPSGGGQQGGGYPRPAAAPQQRPAPAAKPAPAAGSGFDDMDDDIPF